MLVICITRSSKGLFQRGDQKGKGALGESMTHSSRWRRTLATTPVWVKI